MGRPGDWWTGRELAWYRNDGKGGFEKQHGFVAKQDHLGLAGWVNGSVLVASANYEESEGKPSKVLSLSVRGSPVPAGSQSKPALSELLTNVPVSIGPLAVADYDGNGELDLFVGGRVKGGRYPEAVSSYLYRGHDGKLELDATNSAVLKDVGLVNGAVWSDLKADGYAELILACEWGPVRVFRNIKGVLEEATQELGLAEYAGWWNGVTTGDMDGDGGLDIIASNWGGNSKYESHRQRPLRLYYGDFAGDGGLALFESYYDAELKSYVPARMLEPVARAFPFLVSRFPTHESWAEAGIEQVLGDRLQRMRVVEAGWLESTLFFNKQGRFEACALPFEAQLAPAFAVCVSDVDGDGAEDIFLSQNFFGVDADTSRYNAGQGLWLQGDGLGRFRAMSLKESGVKLIGEQRGAAVRLRPQRPPRLGGHAKQWRNAVIS
jgi:hypothetical protein